MSESMQPTDEHGHEPMPEGEEAPPRFVRTAGIVRWFILGAMSLFALVMLLSFIGATPWSTVSGGATQYHCPMHPTYVSSQPGECPICGMDLVPIATDSSTKAGADDTMRHGESHATKFYCSMCPEIVSDTMGECSKCGMNLEAVPVAKPGQYQCPMDLQVVADTPGKCPVCGMHLELVQDDAAAGHTGQDAGTMTNGNVPGLVALTIEPKRLQLIGIRTGTVENRTVTGGLRLTGYVTPDEEKLATISVRFAGWVRTLQVDQTGQAVTKGEPLLTVYSQELYQAEQEYVAAQQAAKRAAVDVALTATRGQILEASGQRLRLLGVPDEEIGRLEREGTAISELVIKSPVAGYVLEKNVEAGQYVGPEQALFRIADLGTVWVLADVYEQDMPAVRTGLHGTMTVIAYPGETFEGSIQYVYPTVSEQTRTIKARLRFANQDMKLKPGMFAEIMLERAGTAVSAVPNDAIMDGGTVQYVFVVRGGTHFEPRQVRLGYRGDTHSEIVSGVAAGDTVVTSANFLIDSESRLQAAISGMSTSGEAEHSH